MITQKRVKELFYYRDGELIRRLHSRSGCTIGDVAGSRRCKKGYSRTKVDGHMYLNHRLIWLFHHGYMPEKLLDHIDRDSTNSRICNLREASNQCNIRNSKVSVNNKSGTKGVYWSNDRGKWSAEITINYKTFRLGCYDDFTEAVAHRLFAEQCLGWSGCDSSSSAYLYMKKYLKALS